MTHDEIREQIPPHVLGALATKELAEVATHLALCEECRREAEAYSPALEALARSAPMAQPSPTLRARLLAQIEPTASSVRPTHAVSPNKVIPWWQRLGDLWPRLSPAWAAMSAILIVALLSVNLVTQRQLATHVARLEQQRNVMGFLSEVEVRAIPMQGTQAATDARGRLFVEAGGVRAALVVYDIPQPPRGQVYQLWLIAPDGQRTSGGLFTVDENGYGTLLVQAPANFDTYKGIGVTNEPERGSLAPTGTRMLAGSF